MYLLNDTQIIAVTGGNIWNEIQHSVHIGLTERDKNIAVLAFCAGIGIGGFLPAAFTPTIAFGGMLGWIVYDTIY